MQLRLADLESVQGSLFGEESALPRSAPELPRISEWTEPDLLAREKESLGFFISGHPLDQYREVVRAFEPVTSRTLADRPGQPIELPCVVTSVTRQISRKNNQEWGKITVEDFEGTATILAFRETWQNFKEILTQDEVILIRGKVSANERDEEDPPVFLDEVRLLDEVTDGGELAIQIELETEAELTDEAFASARQVFLDHPGESPIWLQIGRENGEGSPRLRSKTLKAKPDAKTVGALKAIFGSGAVCLIRAVIPEIEEDPQEFWRDKARNAG